MVFQFAIQLLKGEKARLFERSDKIKIIRSFQDVVDILKRELDIVRENEHIPNPYFKNNINFLLKLILKIQKDIWITRFDIL